jgi:hypothetical protein
MGKLEKMTRLVADGKHNAFTSMTRFGNAIYLTYRTSSGHGASDGRVVLLCSMDEGKNWKKLNSPYQSGRNYYEGFLIEHKGKLFMYGGAFESNLPVSQQLSSTYVSWSSDGVRWSEPQAIEPAKWRFWHPIAIGDSLYDARYRLTTRDNMTEDGIFPPENWEVDLIRSTDGLHWEFVSEISRNEAGNECELFYDGEKLTAFVRRENSPCTLGIRESCPPFEKWSKVRDFGVCMQGIVVKEVNNRRFLFGRQKISSSLIGSVYGDRSHISVQGYVWESRIGYWMNYLQLLGAADCSYPAIVRLDDKRILVSYYSQHEYLNDPDSADMDRRSDIFLATIRTDGDLEWGKLSPYAVNLLSKHGVI